MVLLEKNGAGNIPGISSRIVLEYDTREMAENILKSIEVDNYSFVKCRIDGKRIICVAEAEDVSTLLHTLDDFLACVITAESVYQSI